MLEKALSGSKRYWTLVVVLLGLIGIGFGVYVYQYVNGLGVTGMSRSVSWGLYIAQLTFLVGVAASAVMVVLPYYLHDYKEFGKVAILGEFLAIPSVLMCMIFVVVDLGRPDRMLNIVLHPTPNSPMFWDLVSLGGYLLLNIVIGWHTLHAERKGIAPSRWVKPLIYLSIPWAVSIHTVTAFLYCGIPGRSFWMTAVLAPRFLASAFAAGPSLLILLIFVVRRYTSFDPGKKAIQKLGQIVAYAMCVNVFLFLMEVFVTFYSQIPHHMHIFEYLYYGAHGKNFIVPFMWLSIILSVFSLVLLLNPRSRANEPTLAIAAAAVFVALWLDKGLGLMTAGFVPDQLGHVVEYVPTWVETFVTFGVYGIGFLLLTLLYKVATSVKEEVA